MNHGEFDSASKAGVYQAIHSRRDVRKHFVGGEIPAGVLARVLNAAHHAPSVGFMQPWNFMLIRDAKIRGEICQAFQRANLEAVEMISPDRREKYRQLKLEGILESSLNICVTCDRERTGSVGLGRTAQINMDLFSTVCAVQNLWIAARAEGLGVGWVSIIHQADLRRILNIPEVIEPVAYLCIGPVSEFPTKPDLEVAEWLPRLDLPDLVYCDQWGNPSVQAWPALHRELTPHK